MRCQLAAGLLVICAAVTRADDDDLVIERYQFTWIMAEAGKTQFAIEKNEKSTRARLRHGSDAISMSLEDAELLGAVLARTDKFAEQLKGTKNQNESLGAGKYHVQFQTTEKGDFRVRVSPEKWMRVFATLKPAEAMALAEPMKKAVRAGALVDRKIKL